MQSRSQITFFFFWCRAVGAEFDDLNAKYRDAEKEVNMLQMKIQEVNGNLSKHHKDLECKCYLSFKEVEYKYLVFEVNQCLSWLQIAIVHNRMYLPSWHANRFFCILKYYFPYMWYSF